MLIKHKQFGFTIVELLIVVVVIGILTSITVVSYNKIQDRAKVSSIASGINSVSKGMKMWLISIGRTTWPKDYSLCGFTDESGNPGNNPSMTYLIENCTGLNETLQASPAKHLPEIYWRYDSDGDSKPSPSSQAQVSQGTNLVVEGVSPHIASLVDETIDDGDPLNGNVRINSSTGHIYYSLALSPGAL